MDREQIVVNGCAGKCCENFSFPYSPDELDQLIEAIERGETGYTFTTKEGESKKLIRDPEVNKIKDMLIYLGASKVDPQNTIYTHSELYRYNLCIPDDEPITKPKDLNYAQERYWEWHHLKDGEIYGHTYTCKHFDTEKRICGNYEDRPNMCKNFGRGCKYEGCSFDNKCNNT